MNSDQLHAASSLSNGGAKPEKPETAAGSPTRGENSSWGKKIVLLVDSNARSRESRAKVMRTLGTIVHCASNARAAHSRFEAGPYNLVLVDLGADIEGAEQLAQGIRSKKPGQLVGFLVGSPLFVAKSLKQKANRPPQVPAVSAVPIQKTTMPARMVVDFGQKIRDAEAEQVLDDIA